MNFFTVFFTVICTVILVVLVLALAGILVMNFVVLPLSAIRDAYARYLKRKKDAVFADESAAIRERVAAEAAVSGLRLVLSSLGMEIKPQSELAAWIDRHTAASETEARALDGIVAPFVAFATRAEADAKSANVHWQAEQRACGGSIDHTKADRARLKAAAGDAARIAAKAAHACVNASRAKATRDRAVAARTHALATRLRVFARTFFEKHPDIARAALAQAAAKAADADRAYAVAVKAAETARLAADSACERRWSRPGGPVTMENIELRRRRFPSDPLLVAEADRAGVASAATACARDHAKQRAEHAQLVLAAIRDILN